MLQIPSRDDFIKAEQVIPGIIEKILIDADSKGENIALIKLDISENRVKARLEQRRGCYGVKSMKKILYEADYTQDDKGIYGDWKKLSYNPTD